MIFNVSQLLKEPVGSVRSYEIDDHLSMGTDVPECHVKADVNMLRTDKGIWVTATLDSNVPCTCSRCLAGMEFHVIVNVEEEYLPEVDIFTKALKPYLSKKEQIAFRMGIEGDSSGKNSAVERDIFAIKPFIKRRIRSVKAQLAGKSKGVKIEGRSGRGGRPPRRQAPRDESRPPKD